MSDDFMSDEARKEAARKRLQARQAKRSEAQPSGRVRMPQPHRGTEHPHAQDSAPASAPASERPRAPRPQADARRAPRPQQGQQAPRTRAPESREPRPRVPRPQAQHPAGSQAPRQSHRPQAPRSGANRKPAQAPQRPQQAANALAGAGAAIANAFKGIGNFFANAYANAVDRFGKRNALIGIAAAFVILIILIVAIRACATPADPVQQDLREAQKAVSASSYSNEDGSKPDKAALENLLGAEDTAALLQTASSNEDAYWVASHPDSYTTDGTAVQGKLLRLAGNEPEAASFVRDWPNMYPQDKPSGDASTPSAESKTNVPRLYQWDKRWGYTQYSSTTFALTGCCPTSFAMVYQALTGLTDKSPYDMGVIATNGGFETQYDGTDTKFLFNAAEQLGLTCNQLNPQPSNLTAPLSAGQVLIINVGPGDFTQNGHFIVACGLDADGKVIINDPYSAERSEKTWDVSTLVSQSKMFYAFSLA